MYGSFSDGEQPAARIKHLAAIKGPPGAESISVQGVLARELCEAGRDDLLKMSGRVHIFPRENKINF